jgi:hypothetical protein
MEERALPFPGPELPSAPNDRTGILTQKWPWMPIPPLDRPEPLAQLPVSRLIRDRMKRMRGNARNRHRGTGGSVEPPAMADGRGLYKDSISHGRSPEVTLLALG